MYSYSAYSTYACRKKSAHTHIHAYILLKINLNSSSVFEAVETLMPHRYTYSMIQHEHILLMLWEHKSVGTCLHEREIEKEREREADL